jgi:putative transposase
MVVLPDHIHLLLTLPDQDDDYSFRVSLFKVALSRQLPKNEYITKSQTDKRER